MNRSIAVALFCVLTLPLLGQNIGYGGSALWEPFSNVVVNDMVIDEDNNAYVVGHYNGYLDIDPGPSSSFIQSPDLLEDNGFILKLDSARNLIWYRLIESTSTCQFSRIGLNEHGQIIATGRFTGMTDFTPHASPTTNGVASDGAFVLSYDTSGTYQWGHWVKGYFSGGRPRFQDFVFDRDEWVIALSGRDSIYLNTNNTAYGFNTPDPSAALLRIDTSGVLQSFDRIGTDTSYVSTIELAIDADRSIYCSFEFEGLVDIEWGPGVTNVYRQPSLSPKWANVTYKVDSSGLLLWHNVLTGSGSVETDQLLVDSLGQVYICGDFAESIDFDPTSGTDIQSTSSAFRDALFLMKLNPNNGSRLWNQITPETPSFGFRYVDIVSVEDGGVLAAGVFRDSLDIHPGFPIDYRVSNGFADIFMQRFDSTGVLQTAFTSGLSADDILVRLASAPGHVYHYSGMTEGTGDLNPGPGVDNYSNIETAFVTTISECQTDTVVNQFTTCRSYEVTPTFIIDQTTDTIITLSNAYGCNYTVHLIVTISPIDTALQLSYGDSILTVGESNASYQWYRCDSGFTVITGAVQQQLKVTSDGQYAAVVDVNGCLDTTACFNISNLGDKELISVPIVVYPNPTQGDLTVHWPNRSSQCEIEVVDMMGRIVFKAQYDNAEENIVFSLQHLKSGTYVIRGMADSGYFEERLVLLD